MRVTLSDVQLAMDDVYLNACCCLFSVLRESVEAYVCIGTSIGSFALDLTRAGGVTGSGRAND